LFHNAHKVFYVSNVKKKKYKFADNVSDSLFRLTETKLLTEQLNSPILPELPLTCK